jgi:hypothetical protein
MDQKDSYTPQEVREIAVAFAHVVKENYRLGQLKDFDSIQLASREVLRKIEHYKEVVPENVQERLSNFKELELHCKLNLGI